MVDLAWDAARAQRAVRMLGEHDDVAGEGYELVLHATPAHGGDELAKLVRERLARLKVGQKDVASAVRERVLPERLWVFVDDAVIVDLDRLWAAVLIHDHLLASYDRGAAQLARCQPAELDAGDYARRERERDEGHVGVALGDGVPAEREDAYGHLLKPEQEDRKVVRPEVPEHADVVTIGPQVHPVHGDEV